MPMQLNEGNEKIERGDADSRTLWTQQKQRANSNSKIQQTPNLLPLGTQRLMKKLTMQAQMPEEAEVDGEGVSR